MSMVDTGFGDAPGRRALFWLYPALIGFVVVLLVLQTLPLVLPIGPMYWDVLVYYDAIGRIAQGQWPAIDFFAPVGPLEYFLAAFSARVFPDAQPVLLTQWIWLPVTAPVMALILWDTAKRSGTVALWLFVPWMIFTALPFNVIDFYPYPGTDAFGIYNRHGAHLIYLVAATVLFVRSQVIQAIVLSVLVLSMAFCKITALLAAGPILLFGLVLGRISVKTAIATALVCIGATGIAELSTGMVVPYVQDIILLASQNSDALLPRFLTAISQHFNVFGAGGLLVVALLAASWSGLDAAGGRASGNKLSRIFDAHWFWVGLLLFCSLFYETQNTGGQAGLIIWPALLAVLVLPMATYGRYSVIVLVLIAFSAVPNISNVLHKAARTLAVAPGYVVLDAPDMGPIGRVSAKDVFVEQAERMRGIYIAHRDTYEAIAETGALPSFIMFSDPDYQYLLLQEMQAATVAIKAMEAKTGHRFERVLNLDFANPFPYLLNKKGTEYVAIGADPNRALPELDARTRAAVSQTDLILVPTCPVHHARKQLLEHYASALTAHNRITLTPCFDAFVLSSSP
ncbi:hypothetical protein IMCC20628_00993 [Hoeflea sp. IMCC20628]|uniref:hypothetical protein n=1 Tax=Hoeflea sp. IMCC20628 TaxID=1620421 RepID=UPI00063BDB42|nr:hypothetical protein [Hoeflea sp. IMCC20628]AKH99710.1 hypothetical protein IMCC20628_00993 [Hoeflea sp. IMCC20628]